MKSKLWIFVTILIVASMVLTACKSAQPTAVVEEQATAVPAAQGVTKITIFVGFGTGTSPEQMAVHQQIQDLYNSTHTDIQIEFLTVPYEERITKYATMLAADQVPDMMLPIGVGGIASFYKGWLDLSPYISADNYDMNRFVGVTGEMHNYPGQGMLGLPLCVYPQAMYYNEDIFDAAGVDYPPAKYGEKYADGSTWDFTKVREIAKKMSLDASGNDANSNAFDPKSITQVGWLNWDWYTPIDFTRQFGDLPGGGVSADGTKSVLAEKQYIDALTYYKTAIWDDHVSNDSEQAGAIQGSAGDPFGGGKAAMWENHTWMSYAYEGWDQAFKWNVGAVPQGTNGKVTVIVDADTAVIPAQAKNPDKSWEVMKWLFEPEQYKVLIGNYGCLPADKELVKTWVSDMTAKYPGVNFQIFVDGLDYLETSPNHEAWKPEYNKINDIMTNAVGQIQAGTNTDVQAVMQDANTQVQKLLDDYWAANP